MTENIVWHDHKVSREARNQLCGHKSCVLWYTGLSGSGKSTIANAVDELLHKRSVHTYVLDGDNIRHGLNGDLAFSDKDRVENIRRVGEVAKLFVDSGLIVTTAFISPFRADRKLARKLFEQGEFVEVFIDTPLEVCEQRDPKGLYKKARAGKIPHFTGIDSEYEAPDGAELIVETDGRSVIDCAHQVVAYLAENGYLDTNK
ncbi:adenylyl-sulfate kinase [Echinimonas agarilytica]|uniref:Adenylyl-sulfate kinase n=1 Tax=Echinimonas agarilytica TaxID=1215918 RepID=A0AA42B7C2_9GAMM|nr:adenylyl-sulfate kinase [Echinimonas agarilytica]MCM2679073.1 adenylyl-sulfate kinase [Echinimonas agarilytica]